MYDAYFKDPNNESKDKIEEILKHTITDKIQMYRW